MKGGESMDTDIILCDDVDIDYDDIPWDEL